MKKATLIAIKNALTDYGYMDSDVLSELNREITKGEAEKVKNAELYEQAKAIVFGALAKVSAPVTIGELYDEIAEALPEGFTKGKVQYAVTRLWSDEIAKTEGKVNTYSLKA